MVYSPVLSLLNLESRIADCTNTVHSLAGLAMTQVVPLGVSFPLKMLSAVILPCMAAQRLRFYNWYTRDMFPLVLSY